MTEKRITVKETKTINVENIVKKQENNKIMTHTFFV